MATYLGVVELGTLLRNGVEQPRPTRPWRIDTTPPGASAYGDIPDFNGLADMSKWVIGATSATAANRLKWSKFQDGTKTLLICDRVILANVSWDDLNGQNLVTGKAVTIDGATYKLRLLTGGSKHRSGTDSYSGGSPTANEWDQFIVNEIATAGAPSPVASDLDGSADATDYSSVHNLAWHWYYMYSWCRDTYTGDSAYRALRGYYSARFWHYFTSSDRNPIIGWRPVLEILNTAPLISDSDRNLGDKNSNFSVTYQVNDADAGDTLTVTEKLDGTVVRTITPAQRQYDYTINIDIASLTLATHTITIDVTDGKGGSATRTYTFKRVNAAPTISGQDQNLGDKNLGFQIVYQVNDADNDTLTVTEKLNGNVLRTLNNAPKNQDLTIDISNETLRSLALNSTNNISIEARDPSGGVSYRTYTFRRTNTAPLISGIDEDLGIISGPFTRDYTVADAENDTVVVQVKVDSELVDSFIATLGNSYTATIPEDVWHRLINGVHSLRIEAADGNAALSVRIYTFQKHETKIKFELQAIFETDARPSKILVTPSWQIDGASVKIMACNNALDAVPTWEDITAQVMINRLYNFTNETKTAAKWGINISFEIEKYPEYQGEVSIRGFGGAFE